MTAAPASKVGGQKAFRAHLTALLLLQLYALWEQTRGDYANGVTFYLYIYWNPWAILLYGLLLGMAVLLGRKAGREIFTRPDGYIISGIKYAFIASAMPLLCIFALGTIAGGIAGIMDMLFPFASVVIVSVIIWLWTARSIWKETEQEEKSE
jgi:hypothetical protein